MRTSWNGSFSRAAAVAMLASAVGFGGLSGCQSVDQPTILNVDVEPDSFSLNDIESGYEFRVEADLVYFDSPITNVEAELYDSNNNNRLRFWRMSKSEEISNGERWVLNGTLSLFDGFSVGNYYLSIRVTDSEGDVNESDPEEITITTDENE